VVAGGGAGGTTGHAAAGASGLGTARGTGRSRVAQYKCQGVGAPAVPWPVPRPEAPASPPGPSAPGPSRPRGSLRLAAPLA
jgi:hypothetical protein